MVLAFILVVSIGYYLYSKNQSVVSIITPAETEGVGNDILALVEKLKTVSIDSSFLSSPLFTSLMDFKTALVPEAVGRSNPFSTIGVQAVKFTSTNTKKPGEI